MTGRRIAWLAAALSVTSAASARAAFSSIDVRADHPNGAYAIGEPVRWTIHADDLNAKLAYRVLRGMTTAVSSGDVTLVEGAATVEATLDAPGTLMLEVTGTAADGTQLRSTAGAYASPEKIAISAPKPDDFDAFWDGQIAALNAVPMDAVLTPASQSTQPAHADDPKIRYSKVTLDNIRGTKIDGQLARPVAGEKFPALLIVQWAGVYPLERGWVLDRAREGWLVLNISAHDLPIDEPKPFYADQFAGPLKEYWAIGNDARESSYFLRMYLSCYRGADYLASRDDWDGKTLVVMGGSQGGMQSLVTAGIHPKITAALAMVPAGCDMTGRDVGRKPGWPQWVDFTRDKDAAAVRNASRYYDVANFARRIKCPTLIGLGLIDETCPPDGVFAAVNQIAAAKEILVMPTSGHQDAHGSQKAYSDRCYAEWLPALLKTGAPPATPSTRPTTAP